MFYQRGLEFIIPIFLFLLQYRSLGMEVPRALDGLDLPPSEEFTRIKNHEDAFGKSLIKKIESDSEKYSLSIDAAHYFYTQGDVVYAGPFTNPALYAYVCAKAPRPGGSVELSQDQLDTFFLAYNSLNSVENAKNPNPVVLDSLKILSGFPYYYSPAQELLGKVLLARIDSHASRAIKEGRSLLLQAARDGDNPFAFSTLAKLYQDRGDKNEPLHDLGGYTLEQLFVNACAPRTLSLCGSNLSNYDLVGIKRLDMQFCSPEGMIGYGDFIIKNKQISDARPKAFDYYRTAARLGSKDGVFRLRTHYNTYYQGRILKSFVDQVDMLSGNQELSASEIDGDFLAEIAALKKPEAYRALARYEMLHKNYYQAGSWLCKSVESLNELRVSHSSVGNHESARRNYCCLLLEDVLQIAQISKMAVNFDRDFFSLLRSLHQTDFLYLCNQESFMTALDELSIGKEQCFELFNIMEEQSAKLKSVAQRMHEHKLAYLERVVKKYAFVQAGILMADLYLQQSASISDENYKCARAMLHDVLDSLSTNHNDLKPNVDTSMGRSITVAYQNICSALQPFASQDPHNFELLFKLKFYGVKGYINPDKDESERYATQILESGYYKEPSPWFVKGDTPATVIADTCFRVINLCKGSMQAHEKFLCKIAQEKLSKLKKEKNFHALLCQIIDMKDCNNDSVIKKIFLETKPNELCKGSLRFFVQGGVASHLLELTGNRKSQFSSELFNAALWVAYFLDKNDLKALGGQGVKSANELYSSLIESAITGGSPAALLYNALRLLSVQRPSNDAYKNLTNAYKSLSLENTEDKAAACFSGWDEQVNVYHKSILKRLKHLAKKGDACASYSLYSLYHREIPGLLIKNDELSKKYLNKSVKLGHQLAKLEQIAHEIINDHGVSGVNKALEKARILWRECLDKKEQDLKDEYAFLKLNLEEIFCSALKKGSHFAQLWNITHNCTDYEALAKMIKLLFECPLDTFMLASSDGKKVLSGFYSDALDRVTSVNGYENCLQYVHFLHDLRSSSAVSTDLKKEMELLGQCYQKYKNLTTEILTIAGKTYIVSNNKLDLLAALTHGNCTLGNFEQAYFYARAGLDVANACDYESLLLNNSEQQEVVEQIKARRETLAGLYRALGLMDFRANNDGLNSKQSVERALIFLGKAAELGSLPACKELGLLYSHNNSAHGFERNRLVPFDLEKALFYLTIAASSDDQAKGVLEELKKKADFKVAQNSVEKILSYSSGCSLIEEACVELKMICDKGLDDVDKQLLGCSDAVLQLFSRLADSGYYKAYYDALSCILLPGSLDSENLKTAREYFQKAEEMYFQNPQAFSTDYLFSTGAYSCLLKFIRHSPLDVLILQLFESLIGRYDKQKDNYRKALQEFITVCFSESMIQSLKTTDVDRQDLDSVYKVLADKLSKGLNDSSSINYLTLLQSLLKINEGIIFTSDEIFIQGLAILEKLAKENVPEAYYALGLIGLAGNSLHRKNWVSENVGYECLHKAGVLGCPDAYMTLAVKHWCSIPSLHLQGNMIGAHDFKKIQEYLESAYQLGHQDARALLAKFYCRARRAHDPALVEKSIKFLRSEIQAHKDPVLKSELCNYARASVFLAMIYSDRKIKCYDPAAALLVLQDMLKRVQVFQFSAFDKFEDFVPEYDELIETLQALALEKSIMKDASTSAHLFGMCAFMSLFAYTNTLDEDSKRIHFNNLRKFGDLAFAQEKSYKQYLLKFLTLAAGPGNDLKVLAKDLERVLGLYILSRRDASQDNDIYTFFMFDALKKIERKLRDKSMLEQIEQLKKYVSRIPNAPLIDGLNDDVKP